MTRGYVIFTKDNKKASEVVYLSSSAYPSYYGLELLTTIQSGLPLNRLADSSDPEGVGEQYTLSQFDVFVRAKAITSKAIMDMAGIDYVYVYNTTTKVLTVRNCGVLRYTFDLSTQSEVCRAVFSHDDDLQAAAGINPNSLYYIPSQVDKNLRALVSGFKIKEDVMNYLHAAPRACISEYGKYFVRRGFDGADIYEWRYSIAPMYEEDDKFGYISSYVARIAPSSTQHGTAPKAYSVYVDTPLGQVPISLTWFPSIKAAKEHITGWVRRNMDSLAAYRPVFDSIQSALNKMEEIERIPSITCDSARKQCDQAINEALADITRRIGSSLPISEFFSVKIVRAKLHIMKHDMLERIADRAMESPSETER